MEFKWCYSSNSIGIRFPSSLIVGLIKGITLFIIKIVKKKIYKIASRLKKNTKMQGEWNQIISTYGGLRKINISKKGKLI